jgi:hypothetical protein
MNSRPPPHPLFQDEGLELFVNTTGVPCINPVSWDIGSYPVLSLYFSKLSEYQLRARESQKIGEHPFDQPDNSYH